LSIETSCDASTQAYYEAAASIHPRLPYTAVKNPEKTGGGLGEIFAFFVTYGLEPHLDYLPPSVFKKKQFSANLAGMLTKTYTCKHFFLSRGAPRDSSQK